MLSADVPFAAGRGTVSVESRPSPAGADREAAAPAPLVSFRLCGMHFALAAECVLDVMTLSGERWRRMAEMARRGTLGESGMPLIRLATRLGLEPPPAAKGALLLFGQANKVRASLLVDDVPDRVVGRVSVLPAHWRGHLGPRGEMIGGLACLADGTHAAVIDLAVGVARAGHSRLLPARQDSAHLLVRAGGPELEAVRVAALRGIDMVGEAASSARGRALLLLGGAAETLTVDEVVGFAVDGRIEGTGAARMLVTPTGRYRLREPERTAPLAAARLLLAAPAGEARTALHALLRAMGFRVSLADDARAARLAGGRFDLRLVDLDAPGAAGAVPVPAGACCIGIRSGVSRDAPAGFAAVVPAGDPVALVAALLRHRPRGD